MIKKNELKNVFTTALKTYDKTIHTNPKISEVAASLMEFGLVKNSIVVDEDMVLLSGHTVLKAMQSLGWATVPEVTQVFGLSEPQKKAYRIADNKLGEAAVWVYDQLATELVELDELDFDIALTGFSQLDLNKILRDLEIPTAEEEQSLPIGSDTVIERGDIIRLGKHVIMCGDSTSQDDVRQLMEGQKADMIFTDPPYNVNYTGKTSNSLKIQNDNMDSFRFREFLTDAFTCMFDASCLGAPAYICHADTEGYNFRGAFVDSGWLLKQCLIWEKQNFVLGHQDYHWQHEPILYGWKPGSHTFYGGRNLSTIWNFDRPSANKEHPTMKPISLVAEAVKNSSKKEDLVADFFLGSGATLIACEQLGRACRGMELSPQYCEVICRRWEGLTGDERIQVT